MRYLLYLVGLLLSLSASAQTYFNERYPVAAGYSAATTLLLNGSGYITIGQAVRSSATRVLVLTFVDSAGQLQTTKFFGRARAASLYPGFGDALVRTRDGGMAMAGSMEDSAGHSYGILWRFTAQGDTLWTRTYDAPFGMSLYNGGQVSHGDFVLTGKQYLTTSRTTATDALVIRTDSLGTVRWHRTYHAQPANAVGELLFTRDGGLLVAGSGVTPSTSHFNRDWLLFKLDSLGNLQWRRTFGGPYSDSGGPTVATPDGGYLVAGALTFRVVPPDYSQSKTTLIKLDSAGQVQWQRSYLPAGLANGPIALLVLPDGSYLLGGQNMDTSKVASLTGYPQGFLLNVCATGDSLWYRTYKMATGTSAQNYLRSVRLTPDGGFAGAGFVFPSPPTNTEDVWLFKTDQYGYLAPNGPPVTAQCRPLGLAPPTAPDLTISPNPSPDGRFTLHLTPSLPATLTVTDALGRVVLTQAAPAPATLLNLSTQPPGLYALRLTWPDGRTLVRRLVR